MENPHSNSVVQFLFNQSRDREDHEANRLTLMFDILDAQKDTRTAQERAEDDIWYA